MRIPLSAPDITESEIEAVVQVLRTPRLSLGPVTEQFEAAVARSVFSASRSCRQFGNRRIAPVCALSRHRGG